MAAGLIATAVASLASAASRPPVAATCPARAVLALPVSRWAPARDTLAPAGPVAIRLCRYSGLNAHPRLALTGRRTLTGAGRITALVRGLDRLPTGPSGPVACPNDDESQILAILSYPAGRPVRITLGLSGCNAVTNGIVWRTAGGFGSPPDYGPQLLAELKRLTG